MKFFRMEKWGKRSFSLAFILSIFSIIIVAYVVKISKESWNYRIDETQCHKREGVIEKVQDGKEISNGKILKFIKALFLSNNAFLLSLLFYTQNLWLPITLITLRECINASLVFDALK